MQERAVQLGQPRRAGQRHRDRDLLLQDLQHTLHAGLPLGGQRVAVEPAQGHRVGAERDGLHDVGAAAEPAIDDHARPPAHRLQHLGQHVHRAASVIELAASVVGDVDDIDPMLAGDRCILGSGDPLQDQRDAMALLEVCDVGARRIPPGTHGRSRPSARA